MPRATLASHRAALPGCLWPPDHFIRLHACIPPWCAPHRAACCCREAACENRASRRGTTPARVAAHGVRDTGAGGAPPVTDAAPPVMFGNTARAEVYLNATPSLPRARDAHRRRTTHDAPVCRVTPASRRDGMRLA
ncbi:hypothetical protein C7S14_0795 [Burkholderia cepacia]|nr:hypothetical protein C7S14_0795 [Burkholderia cepacia]